MMVMRWLFRGWLFFAGASVACWVMLLLAVLVPGDDPMGAFLACATFHSVVALLFGGLWLRQRLAHRDLVANGRLSG